MWFDRPSWLNPSAFSQMEITSPSVHSYAPIPPYCSAFQLTSELFYRKRRLFFQKPPFLYASTPLTPKNSLNMSHPRSQGWTGGLCALLHEACLLFTFAFISCSLSHHGAGDPGQQGRYLGEQCWVFRISVSTEKACRSPFSSPDFRHSHWMERKEGYGEA